jgi:hypothetical protein
VIAKKKLSADAPLKLELLANEMRSPAETPGLRADQ